MLTIAFITVSRVIGGCSEAFASVAGGSMTVKMQFNSTQFWSKQLQQPCLYAHSLSVAGGG